MSYLDELIKEETHKRDALVQEQVQLKAQVAANETRLSEMEEVIRRLTGQVPEMPVTGMQDQDEEPVAIRAGTPDKDQTIDYIRGMTNGLVAMTAEEIYRELQQRYHFSIRLEHIHLMLAELHSLGLMEMVGDSRYLWKAPSPTAGNGQKRKAKWF